MGAREAIVSAADSVFGEVGFDAASTREIAERSGVNKALIHYHFGTQEGLLEIILDGYYEKLGATVREALGGEGSLRHRLERLVDAYSDFLSRNQGFCRIVQREASGGRNAHLIRERMLPLFALAKGLVREHYPTTETGELAAEQLLISAYGMLITYFTYSDVIGPLVGTDPMSPSSLEARRLHVRRVIDVLLVSVEAAEEEGQA